MLTKIYSAAINGIDALPVTIETVVNQGIGFSIVGMADQAVRESYQRMTAALTQTGLRFPHGRITVNLSPADVRKEGASFDLPIAIGLLTASDTIPCENLGD